MSQENEGLSKEAVEIGKTMLEDGFVAREQLEALSTEVFGGGYASPMEGVRAITERMGLTEESRLNLRRIVMASAANKDLTVGQKVRHVDGRSGIVTRLGAPVKGGSAMVHFASAEDVELVYISDLKK